MKAYIFRHAQKDFSPSSDPGLTTRGHEQARALVESVIQLQSLPNPHSLWISPKKRTYETFFPLAQSLKMKAIILPELNERQHNEDSSKYHKRILTLIDKIENFDQQKNLFLCTHADILEEILTAAPVTNSVPIHSGFAPTSFIEFEIDDLKAWRFVKFGGPF